MRKNEKEDKVRFKNSVIISFRLNFDDPIDSKIYTELFKLPRGDRSEFIKNALYMQVQRMITEDNEE